MMSVVLCPPALAREAHTPDATGASAEAKEELVEHYADGQLKRRCRLDREGRLNGECLEYYPDGTLQVRSKYRRDELIGKYASYHADGSAWINTTYTKGVLSGKYTERRADGVRRIEGVYKRGLREGIFSVIDGRKTVREQRWVAGELTELDGAAVHPRPVAEVWETLAAIYDPTIPRGGKQLGLTDAPSQKKRENDAGAVQERDDALRRFMAYRYLAGVEWEDMTVSARFNYHGELAARLLYETNSNNEVPENPGWPRKQYQHAKHGAQNSVFDRGHTLLEALGNCMAEIGTGVGRRIFLLDPRLMTTGFGRHEDMVAIWFEDESRTSPADYDWITFPARGVMPVDHFGALDSWSLMLNPGNHAPITFKNDVSVRLFALDEDWVRTGEQLPLERITVFDRTISFRPVAFVLTPGARYEVQYPGIRHDKVGSTLTYFVEFAETPPRKSAGPDRGREAVPLGTAPK